MNKAFLLEIVTPEKQLYGGSVEQIICCTEGGKIGILKGHAPMIATLAEGKIELKEADGWKTIAIHEGFMEVTDDGVVIFTQNAE